MRVDTNGIARILFENLNVSRIGPGSSDGHRINFCIPKDPATYITLITLHIPVGEIGMGTELSQGPLHSLSNKM